MAQHTTRHHPEARSQAVVPLAKVMGTVRRAAIRILGARHPDLEDTIQESLLACVMAWGAFRAECHPAGYAGRIATREAIRTLRRGSAYRRKVEHFARSSHSDEQVELSEGPERARVIAELLARLPRAQREALVSRVVEELSLEEISQRSGAPANTIRSRVRLARDNLRAHLKARPSLAAALSVV